MDPHRYAVPLEQLDGVRVDQADQVSEQAEAHQPDASQWAGAPLHPFGGGGGDGDGD